MRQEVVTDRPRPDLSLALVGQSKRTQSLAPWHDERWAIMGLNTAHNTMLRANMWFQLHRPALLYQDPEYCGERPWDGQGEPPANLAFLCDATIPIWAQEHFPQWPKSVALPMADLERRFNPLVAAQGESGRRVAWTSSMALMLGLGILLAEQGQFGPRIGIWGFDLMDDYRIQGPSFGYLVAQAEAAGIEVVVPPGAGLFRQAFLYGYQDEGLLQRYSQISTRRAELHEVRKLLERGMREAQGRLDVCKAEVEDIRLRSFELAGQLKEVQHQLENWTDDESRVRETENAQSEVQS